MERVATLASARQLQYTALTRPLPVKVFTSTLTTPAAGLLVTAVCSGITSQVGALVI
jgi:hypothetical protein